MIDKKGLLPIVTEEVGYTIQAELKQSSKNDYIREMLERLQEDNPCVANFISKMSLSSDDATGTAYTALLTYRLLESQAEADRLNDEW